MQWILGLALRFATTRFGGWFFTTLTPPIDKLILQASNGRWSIGLKLVPIMLLTTHGRVSGLKRMTPLLYQRFDDKFAVIASGGGSEKHPNWYLNLRADPTCHVLVDGQSHTTIAVEVHGEDYARLWQQFIRFNPGFALYQVRISRHIPILCLSLADPSLSPTAPHLSC